MAYSLTNFQDQLIKNCTDREVASLARELKNEALERGWIVTGFDAISEAHAAHFIGYSRTYLAQLRREGRKVPRHVLHAGQIWYFITSIAEHLLESVKIER